MSAHPEVLVEPDRLDGYAFPEARTFHTSADVSLHALAIGMGEREGDLRWIYEGAEDFAPHPMFLAAQSTKAMLELYATGVRAPGANYGFDRLLAGEYRLMLHAVPPVEGVLVHRARIGGVYDLGAHARIDTVVETSDARGGDLLSVSTITHVVLGGGGIGRGRPPQQTPEVIDDDAVQARVRVDPRQALLYRLTGDLNPIHVDPAFARLAGLKTPILHGQCTLAVAVNAALAAVEEELTQVREVSGRFLKPVAPEAELFIRAERRDRVVLFEAESATGGAVLGSGRVVLE